jgi:hypothetical protein
MHKKDERNFYKIIVWNPQRKRPLDTPGCIWADNIKTDQREIE